MRTGLVVAVSVALAACAIGPNYHPPEVEEPPAFRGEETPAATSIADLPWWEVFRDPVLKGLIEEALAQNYDLRIAASRVEQARYAVGVVRADALPQAGYQGSAERGKFFSVGGNDTHNAFFAALQTAWEIDLWGRIRRATEASLADLYAAEDTRRGVVLSLVTDVAQAYLELRELDLELEIALRTRDSFQDTLDLFERQLRGGVGTKLATSRAEAALANTSATIPDLERRIVAKENQLSILLGRPPGEIARGTSLVEQDFAPEVPAGLPSALLRRRPDVLQSEQNIVAANAQVGVAIANFLPRIGLTALYGGQSSELEDILKSSSEVWSIAASVTGPLFQSGRLYYGYKFDVAAWEASLHAYEGTVLNALAEVSNALVARQKFVAANAELERQVRALQDAVTLSNSRYTGGLANYYEVLEAQQELFPAENALALNRLDSLVSIVQLYRALGGGWQAEEAAHPEQYPLRRDALDKLVPAGGRRAHP
ncbi:MAG: efflux transporter outer membrane subunit [Deltaproteobacteria bacterium]|nr:MAG: efflux transporter outer membrane subunit [Deltaproteobacteria bacterium]